VASGIAVIGFKYGSFAGTLALPCVSGMIDVMRSDSIRNGRAKGLPENKVVYKLRAQIADSVITLLGNGCRFGKRRLVIEAILGIPGSPVLSFFVPSLRPFSDAHAAERCFSHSARLLRGDGTPHGRCGDVVNGRIPSVRPPYKVGRSEHSARSVDER